MIDELTISVAAGTKKVLALEVGDPYGGATLRYTIVVGADALTVSTVDAAGNHHVEGCYSHSNHPNRCQPAPRREGR
jgi:hypothetical protein